MNYILLFLVIPHLTLLANINQYRAAHNLQPITLYMPSCVMAAERLADMYKDYSHAGFNKRALEFARGEYHENLAHDWENDSQVLDAWEKSPTHNANLLAKTTKGCIVSDGTYWVFESYER